MPLKKGEKERNGGQSGKSNKFQSRNSRPNKNKYKESFTFNYGNYVKQSMKNGKFSQSSSNQNKKKSRFSNLKTGTNDQNLFKQIKKLYMKEIGTQQKKSTSNWKKSPNRSRRENSDFDNRSEDSFSQMSEFSEISKNNFLRSKDSISQLGSADRKNRQKELVHRKSSKSFEKMLSLHSGKRSQHEIELKNDEFIEIQGMKASNKKIRNKAKGNRNLRSKGKAKKGVKI